MQQVVFIHGGTTFYEYKDYLNYLRSKPVRISDLTRQRLWFNRLQEDLGDDFQVLAPVMPNGTNAKYDEWAIWFGRIAEVVEDNVILVGHSMGGIFLAKPIKMSAARYRRRFATKLSPFYALAKRRASGRKMKQTMCCMTSLWQVLPM